MTITANSVVIRGSLQGSTLYTNTVAAGEATQINVNSDLKVTGNVLSEGRIEFGTTIYATMRAAADFAMSGNEHFISGYDMILDETQSDPVSLLSVMATNNILSIWDWEQGRFIVPADGFYNLQIQGSFINTVPDATNGVYWYFRSRSNPNARIAATMSKTPIVYSTTSTYLMRGDIVQPAFYSSDAAASLSGNGETYLSFYLPNTTKPRQA